MPVHLLAAVGLWRVRRRWREHLVVGVVFLAFALTTAVFWAHTSHKSYLDVFLFVYASAGVVGFAPAYFRRGEAVGPAEFV